MGVGVAIESEIFIPREWTIRFYPEGMDEIAHTEGYTSLYVCLKSKIAAPVEFSLLDQSGKGNHVSTSVIESNERFVRANNPVFKGGYLKFIERAIFERRDYLKGDCLKISCTIEILASHIRELSLANVGSHLSKLLESKEGAYVFFKVQGESFCAHKSLLAVCFPAFWSLFSASNRHKEIAIPNMEPSVFKAVLQFIYTGTFRQVEEEANPDKNLFLLKMLGAAHEFQLEELKRICEWRIMKCLSIDSVAFLLPLADLPQILG